MLIISEIRGNDLEIKFLPRFFFYMLCSFIKQYKRQKIPYLLLQLMRQRKKRRNDRLKVV
ncbi:hypothetical protein BACSTE_01204 [Bacteroides stercoris ATCC 43183]|uniref:Uncharacterized protein n=2 Tax=Bacteroides stercoris TaxID=46506 RepID=A0A413VBL1_BACSE|nr:hypothetical protein BACSTE_01204 [Bacteroides stercoris ATCC 43183]RHB31001.1 hypothetical protein DW889_05370 [Bacteroides stercoris]